MPPNTISYWEMVLWIRRDVNGSAQLHLPCQRNLLQRSARADLSDCLPGVPAQPAAQVEKEAPVEWLFVQWADGNFGPG